MSNLALVKPDKANAVENYLIQLARYGKLAGKVRKRPPDAWMLLIFFLMPAVQWMDFLFYQISESGLIEILEKVSQQTEKKTTVTVSSSEVSPVFDSFTVTWPSYIIYALYLSVQQTEGDGLRWWGWLLTSNGSPGSRQEICRGYALLGLWYYLWPVSWILGCHTSFCVSRETTSPGGKNKVGLTLWHKWWWVEYTQCQSCSFEISFQSSCYKFALLVLYPWHLMALFDSSSPSQ